MLSSTAMPSISRSPLLLLFFLLSFSVPAESFFFGQYRSIISLSHSLMIRVSELRASRGDFSGSERARKIAEKLEGGLNLWGGIWSMSWDYVRNYAWRSMSWTEMFNSVTDVNRLLKVLSELTQMNSDMERATWVMRNYQSVLGTANSLFRRLLQVFARSGPLRDLILTLQREADGGLLKDCLEVGSSDLQGLLQIVKEFGLQFSKSKGDNKKQDL